MFSAGATVGGLQLQVYPALSQLSSIFNAIARVSCSQRLTSRRHHQTQSLGGSTIHGTIAADLTPTFKNIADELRFELLHDVTIHRLCPLLNTDSRWTQSHVSANSFFENKNGFTERQLAEAEFRQSPSQSFHVSLPNLPSRNGLCSPRLHFRLDQHRGFKTKHSTGSVGINQHKQTRDDGPSILSTRTGGLLGRKLKLTNQTKEEVMMEDLEKLTPEEQARVKVAFFDGFHSHGSKKAPETASSPLLNRLKSLLAPALIVLILYYVGSAALGGPRIGLLRGDKFEVDPEETTVTFDDVKGVDEAKSELMDVVQYLRNPEKFQEVGAKMPKGVLLCGPPGVGKTLLARAVAGEADVPFFLATGSEFDDMFVGTGAKKIRHLFEAAVSRAPCVIFIDEIDAVGSKRSVSPYHPYANQTINQLLSEVDGFSQKEGIILLGATNRREDLDKALLRPGRFDVEVNISVPDLKGRRDILELYMKKIKLGSDVDIDKIARSTTGRTGADLANIVNQAALRCVITECSEVIMAHLEYALDKTFMGPAKKSKILDEDTNRCTAYHEAGHTLTAYYTKDAHPLHKVTLLPRGSSLGHTAFIPEKDLYLHSKAQLLAQLDICMGGRAAEELILGTDNITTGAASDFSEATKIATAMVVECGMSDKIGVRVIERSGNMYQGDTVSEATNEMVDSEIKRLLQESYERSKNVLKGHQSELKALAQALLKYETLDAEEVKLVIEGRGKQGAIDLILEDRRLARSNKTTGSKHTLHPKRNTNGSDTSPLLA